MKGSAIERLVRMAETERITQAALSEAIAELSDVREWAVALDDLADLLDQLGDAADEWVQAERDERPDARAAIIETLVGIWSAYDDLVGLPSMGLGPDVTP